MIRKQPNPLNIGSPRMQELNNLQTYLRQFAKGRDWDQFHSPKSEFIIPLTNRRVDFNPTVKDTNRPDTAVIVKSKQWQEVEVTRKDAIVKTRFQHG
jgi:hypothetical protein